MNKVLVLAVHPDDETLGCGGTLLKHKKDGDRIYWLIATTIKEGCGFSKNEVLKREHEIQRVANKYRFDGIYRLNIPTTKTDITPIGEITNRISEIFADIKPDVIYLPFHGDTHSDHRIIFDAAYSCTKSFRFPFIKRLLMMETISETEFSPCFDEATFKANHFVDISRFLDKKIDIMKVYKSEIGTHPFPRSPKNIKALATFRGANAGLKYAEGFMVLKEIR